MTNFLSFLILGGLCLVLQSTFLAYLGVGGLRVELLLILLTYIALRHPLIRGCLLAAVLGYLYDLSSGSPFGLHIFTFSSCFLVLNITREQLYVQGPTFGVGLTAAMVLFQEIISWIVLASRDIAIWPGASQVLIVVPMALLTGCLWPVLSVPMEWIDRKFGLPYQAKARRTGLEFRM